MEKFTSARGRRGAAEDDQCRYRHDHPEAVSEDDQAHRPGQAACSAEKRYRDDGSENPDFVLNKPAYRKAKILVAGDNFGCGSSREHAPWALLDFGIRCVISTSFGDIFYNNCFKNGILPIKVSPEDLEKLFDDAERGANATLSIDLAKQEIRGPDGGVVKFEIDPFASTACSTGSTTSASRWSRRRRSRASRKRRRRRGRGHDTRGVVARIEPSADIARLRRAMAKCGKNPGFALALNPGYAHRLSCLDRLADRDGAARHVGMQPFDHAAIELHHALVSVLRQVEGGDDLPAPARPRPRSAKTRHCRARSGSDG